MVIRQGDAAGHYRRRDRGAAFFLAKLLASLLFEVEPRDLVVFVTIPIVLILVALVAVWIPAQRASRVDPLDALRYQ
jgi:ABC-type lipoprotein release transport system permease subunit